MFERVKQKIQGESDRIKQRVLVMANSVVCRVALLMVCCMALASSSFAAVTIPECLGTGVTMGDYITAAIVSLGAVVAVVVGGYFAFRIIVMGMKWVRHLG